MSLPNAKDLKKLADACRKAGIKTLKCDGIEFTLSDEAPVSNYKKKTLGDEPKATSYESVAAQFESDELTPQQLMDWSIPDPIEEKAE